MRELLQCVILLTAVHKTTGADKVVYAQVGETVSLNGILVPSGDYGYWFFGTERKKIAWIHGLGTKHEIKEDPWKLSLSDQYLTIKTVQEGNFGVYTFSINNDPSKGKKTYRVVKVNVTMNPESPLVPNENLSLSCNVEVRTKVSWTSPNGKTLSGNQINKIVGPQDSGIWKCSVGENTFNKAVHVISLPFDSSIQYTSTNSPLFVPFFIAPSNMIDKISEKIQKISWDFIPQKEKNTEAKQIFSLDHGEEWRREEKEIGDLSRDNFTREGSVSLHRKQAREDDGGNYTCSILFKGGFTLKSTVEVQVLQIIASPGTELISGQQLNLSCTTGAPLPPQMHVKVSHPKLSAQHGEEGPLATLKVATEHSGKWSCELWQGDTKKTSAEITLKIDPVLSVWMVVTICSGGVILILLIVVAFILRRRQQRKRRRSQLCKCKNPMPKGFYKT